MADPFRGDSRLGQAAVSVPKIGICLMAADEAGAGPRLGESPLLQRRMEKVVPCSGHLGSIAQHKFHAGRGALCPHRASRPSAAWLLPLLACEASLGSRPN